MFKHVLAILGVLLLAFLAWEWITFPNVADLANEMPRTTPFMEQRKAELRRAGKDDTLLYTPVPYGRVSPYLRRAVLVAEDDTFYEHGGIDVKALQEAIQKDWERKKITQGGSTITQQLAKNLYLSGSRNPLRKIKEYVIARALENHLTKKRILEIYLNVVEMGDRVYGAEAAAQVYFNQPASSLSPQQAALLAGCLPNPRLMNPGEPNARLRSRQRMILSRMRRWGYLFERQVLAERVPVATPPTDTLPPELTETTATTETTETTGTTGGGPAPSPVSGAKAPPRAAALH